jgi:hypothetical protein
MKTPTSKVTGWLTESASRLRFPYLLALTAILFVLDLIVIDPIPGVDEGLLLLLTVILSRLKKRKTEEKGDQRQAEREDTG